MKTRNKNLKSTHFSSTVSSGTISVRGFFRRLGASKTEGSSFSIIGSNDINIKKETIKFIAKNKKTFDKLAKT